MSVAEAVVIRAADGHALRGTLWSPGGQAPRERFVVVNAGAGIPARYYDRFAAWLADRGVPTLTYDYRGIATSAPASLRGFEANIEAWGTLDGPAALEDLSRRYPGARPCVVGHSIGGFVTGIMPGGERVERMVLVGTHTGYWRDYAPGVRLPMFLAWHVALPWVARAFGYVPARPFGLPADLPAGVARDWSGRRRPDPWWNLKGPDGRPDRARIELAIARFDAFRAKTLVVSLADDPFATPAATARMAALFRHCSIEERRFDPRALGLPRVGHFGFFRSRLRETLWPGVGDFLAG